MGAGSLKILTGVLVHRVARPLRGSVSCGSGWSVPCVSIQLTLSQHCTDSLARCPNYLPINRFKPDKSEISKQIIIREHGPEHSWRPCAAK